MMAAATAAVGMTSVVHAQDLVNNFDPTIERDAQREEVSRGRTVLVDFNSPLDYAGSVMFCDETAPNSKIYVPKGNGRYPIVKDRELTTEELDDPKRTRRVIVEKNGSLAGWGAAVKADFKRLVEVSTFEAARAEVPQQLDAAALRLANSTLKLAGGKEGDTACYIWSVSKLSTQMIVDEQKKFSVDTPGIFIVAGKASFSRVAANIRRDDYATVIMSPFVIGADEAPPIPDAVIASDAFEEATAAEQDAAEAITEIAREDEIVRERSIDAGVVFSETVRDKFERLTTEEMDRAVRSIE